MEQVVIVGGYVLCALSALASVVIVATQPWLNRRAEARYAAWLASRPRTGSTEPPMSTDVPESGSWISQLRQQS